MDCDRSHQTDRFKLLDLRRMAKARLPTVKQRVAGRHEKICCTAAILLLRHSEDLLHTRWLTSLMHQTVLFLMLSRPF